MFECDLQAHPRACTSTHANTHVVPLIMILPCAHGSSRAHRHCRFDVLVCWSPPWNDFTPVIQKCLETVLTLPVTRGCSWHLAGGDQGRCSGPCIVQDAPSPPKSYRALNVSSAKVTKLWTRDCIFSMQIGQIIMIKEGNEITLNL